MVRSHAELIDFYSAREKQFSAESDDLSKRINLISNARLVVALAFIIIIFFAFSDNNLFAVAILLAGLFVILVRNHSRLFEKRTHLQYLAEINRAELHALRLSFNDFENGVEFVDPHHPYTNDLDIFGPGSMYQYLGRCNTISGKQKLAARLSELLTQTDDIIATQDAVKDLAGRVEFRQNYQAAGKEMGETKEDRQQLLNWIKLPDVLYGKSSYRILFATIPWLTVLSIIAAFYSDVFRPIAILLAGFQWGFLGLHSKHVNLFHDYVSRKRRSLEKYANLLHYLNVEQLQAPKLVEFKKKAKNADQQIRSLASMVQMLDTRLNSMTMLVMNSLFMWDLQQVYRLERWKEQNATNLETWMDIVADMEVLSSFGNFAFNNPHFTFPEINPDFAIRAEGMGHPLISPSECIPNDLKVGSGPSVLIVTGANMAGKSTFLRTIGINVVLALNGLPVYASKFSCPLLQLRTGMRTADSLQDHQSYFYAELDRLKRIMDDLRKDTPLLILLDEILKGTNSTDKQAGSVSLVTQLLPHRCLALIATHDLVLGDLEKKFPEQVRNYHFEANIDGDQLSFDYKLKPGIAEKMNATFLMKKMGIIPS